MPLEHSTNTVARGKAPGSNDSRSYRSIRTGRGAPLDLLALARQLVQPAAVDLERGDHRWHLLDVADERRHRGADVLLGDGHLPSRQLLARGVERARGDTEGDDAAVLLRRLLQEPHEPRDPAEPDEEHAGRVGVERAGMTDPALAGRAAELGDDVVARPAGGLVDDEQPVDHAGTGLIGDATVRATRGCARPSARCRRPR